MKMRCRHIPLAFMLLYSYTFAIGQSENLSYDFVVAKDGSGDFRTVQEAINAVPDFRKQTTTVFIKKGVYKEKLILPASKNIVNS